MEKALLEGEHSTEMDHLQNEQSSIGALKKRHANIMEAAARRRLQVVDTEHLGSVQ